MIKPRIWYLLIGGIKTKIEGPAVLRLPPGGTLSLQCTISRLNLPPKNLHWKHESTVLTSRTRPGVSLESEKLSGESNTKLVIVDLKSSDEGTYQCVTDASRPATVRLFIGKIRKVSYPTLTHLHSECGHRNILLCRITLIICVWKFFELYQPCFLVY